MALSIRNLEDSLNLEPLLHGEDSGIELKTKDEPDNDERNKYTKWAVRPLRQTIYSIMIGK